jgi:hypothetical protein
MLIFELDISLSSLFVMAATARAQLVAASGLQRIIGWALQLLSTSESLAAESGSEWLKQHSHSYGLLNFGLLFGGIQFTGDRKHNMFHNKVALQTGSRIACALNV